MFNEEKINKIIIVCDKKRKVYAYQLLQLIGSNDDREGEVVGSKDGTVEATVWEESHFLDNEPTISSDEKIIFIGNSKSARSVIPNITEKFNEFGIHYGWMGNRAALYVEKGVIKKDEYDSFFEYCKTKQKEFSEKARLNKFETTHPVLKWGAFILPYIKPFAFYNLIAGSKTDRMIKDQQYNFSVYNIYMEHLSEFLGE